MIISYSLIIIFMLAALTLILTRNYSDDLKQNEIDYEKQIIKRVADYSDAHINTARNIIKQIYSSYGSQQEFIKFLSETDTELTIDNYNQRNKYNNIFESAASASNDILDIIVVKTKMNSAFNFKSLTRTIDESYDFLSDQWFMDAGKDLGVLKFVPSYSPRYIKNDNRPVFSAYAGFLDSQRQLAGILIVNFDAKSMQKAYAEYTDRVKGYIIVTDKTGRVYFDSTCKNYGSVYPYFNLLKDTDSYIMLETESIVAMTETKNGLTVAGIVPKAQILRRINVVIRTIYLIMSLCILISIVLIYLLSTHFSRRVKSIMKAMTEVEKGNLKKRIPAGRGNDEIEKINSNFNRMCEKLESYIDKVYLAEIKAKDAQLTALQTQINPHFLYNTLESIRMKAIVSNNEDISEMIYILATLFKSSVKNKDMVIRIEDEVDYCKSYLELHKIRLGDRLRVEFDISEDIKNHAILKLVLQPLIENSLEYGGVNDNLNTMTITVSGYKHNGAVYISVRDNGAGMYPHELDELKKSLESKNEARDDGSIGLRNINDRIRIFFGESYGLDISSERNSYTKVTVSLPAMSIEEVNRRVQNTDS